MTDFLFAAALVLGAIALVVWNRIAWQRCWARAEERNRAPGNISNHVCR
jgi:hypothetical protein